MVQNLEQYKTFYYIARLSGITAAAQALFVSQSAVSQTLKNIEEELGCKLFERKSKGVKLTPEGELLYKYVSESFDKLAEGEHKLKQMLNYELGEIKIGASDMTLRYYLLEKIEAFKKLYPKIRISVTNAPTPATIRQLKNGELDFAAVSSPFEENKNLTVYKVKEIQDIFIAGPKYLIYKNMILPLSKLSDFPFVCLEKDTSTRKFTDNFLATENVYLQPDFEICTSDLIVDFVERNMGIGIVMEDFAKQSIANNKTFRLRTEKALPKRAICIVTHEKNSVSVAGQKFLDNILTN